MQWIKIYHRIQECEAFRPRAGSRERTITNRLYYALWVDFLIWASSDNQDLERGNFYADYRKITAHAALTKHQLRFFLDKLTEEKMIQRKKTKKGSVISIVNFGQYQEVEIPSQPPVRKNGHKEVIKSTYVTDDEFQVVD